MIPVSPSARNRDSWRLMNKRIEQIGLPWYREFWPWFIITLIGSVVIASLYTVSLAFKYKDDLVVDDYYKVGLAINQRAEHRDRAEDLGISAEFAITSSHLRVRMTGLTPSQQPQLHLSHPLDADKDISATLLPGPDNWLFIPLNRPIEPSWYWSISHSEPEEWLISGRFNDAAFANDRD